MTEIKVCANCKEPKPIAQFGIQNSNADGRRSICKPCRVKHSAKFTAKNKKEKDWFKQFSPI